MAVSKRGYVCIWMGKDIGQTRDRGNGICSICYPPNSKTVGKIPTGFLSGDRRSKHPPSDAVNKRQNGSAHHSLAPPKIFSGPYTLKTTNLVL